MPNDRGLSWRESDVLDISPSMQPPQFMLPGEKVLYDAEERESVVEEHYNWAVGILDEGNGYHILITIIQRLNNHISEADKIVCQYRSRNNYARLKSSGTKRKVSYIIDDKAEENTRSESLEDMDLEEANKERRRQKDKVLNEPIGEHWKQEDGSIQLIPPKEEWSVTAPNAGFGLGTRSKEKVPLSDIRILFSPDQWNTEIDEDHLRPVDDQGFNGEETWRAVIKSLDEKWKSLEENLKKARQTANLLSFRLSVVKTVLYRFEAFGDTTPMSDEAAQAAANLEPPQIFENRSTLLGHAEKIVHKYQEDSASLPETMSQFHGWLGTNGESMVTQLQRAIHEADLSERYEDGNPESFCELVETLVNRHYTN